MGKHEKHTSEEKLKAVMSFKNDSISGPVLARQYRTDRTVILEWVRKYEHGGIEELTKETRGGKGRPKKAVFSSIEDELEQVKMERDLLKKVSTLREKLIKK